MKNFNDILFLIDEILGENGCMWGKKQTIFSLKKHLLEETEEAIEAIDLRDEKKIQEEIGDVLYNCIFLLKVASIDVKETIDVMYKKIIRRNPHVFKGEKCSSLKDIEKMWKMIKKEEKAL